MEDLGCKARLVVGVHVMEPPSTIMYVSVVSRETLRIAMTFSPLNDLPVKLADIQNAYITESVTENIWTVLGQDFGEDDGRKSVVVQEFYGLKSAGATFWSHLVDCMHHLGLLLCTSNLDIWVKPMVRPEDGFD